MILTKRIQLQIDCREPEKRREYYARIFGWQNVAFRAANLVVTHQFLLQRISELMYLSEGAKVRLSDEKVKSEGILNCSRMSTTYRVISGHYKGKLPSYILSALNRLAIRKYDAQQSAYWSGERSLSNHKKDMAMPFSGAVFRPVKEESGRNFVFKLFKVPFRTYLGRDRSDKFNILKRVAGGQLKVLSAALQIVKGKIFLIISYEAKEAANRLEEHVIAEASLSAQHPITVTIGRNSHQIGSTEEFLYRRMAIQSARSRLQAAAAWNRGGHGRKKKESAVRRLGDREKRYVEAKLHLYSRKLIDICTRSGAGTLLLVNQSAKEEAAKEDVFLLRNWSYYGLVTKIKYKAELAGINVIVE
ncbi:hypothetical protein [Sphingobacterium griseoflavum]|uniref:Transposase n=1 Tax=Sphingobacterium griseoflavum TaxID=1474952 RepID=A0ABQ3HRZ1_9SPHI|nr:hypothetical protein [Sphingobacterium griseoflavum]GHE29103.1 hypothetical protein GCM10017764_09710 [Sphingobacterium griseoflavum]